MEFFADQSKHTKTAFILVRNDKPKKIIVCAKSDKEKQVWAKAFVTSIKSSLLPDFTN